MIEFKLKSQTGNARTGEIKTKHGSFLTPVFMPVGTCASVKAMQPESVAATGANIILGNTYHLMLRPGAERVAEFGGLHKFMNWNKSILTDSGGFQVMSLSKIRKITEEGVIFRSHIDGSKILLSPERSMEIQYLLGSDITMCFDECTPFPISYKNAKKSMYLSMRWEERSKKSFIQRPGFGLFGIVQGSVYRDLREESIKILTDVGFDGYAIGGVVGKTQEDMFSVLDYAGPMLPYDKPRYLMGVGKPSDILGSVKRGIDMFDCVMPSRSGRNGQAFVRSGTINIRNNAYNDDKSPLDNKCICPACTNYTKGYLNHLVRSKEILGSMLMTWHNIQHYQDLMSIIRKSINNGYLPDSLEELWSLE